MTFTIFAQIFLNVVFIAGFLAVFARLRRPAKDDPRLSRGLQLLSSKIAVLEDLSDRTESQVNQMLQLLDQKSRELQAKIALADTQVQEIRMSMEKSLEVAKIFQDKIPHTEIIERQNSMKYIQAARLAHAGATAHEIAQQVDLPFGEIEFISKVNRESLTFREEELPAWAREPKVSQETAPAIPASTSEVAAGASEASSLQAEMVRAEQERLVQRLGQLQFEMKNLDIELSARSTKDLTRDYSQVFETPQVDNRSLERIGEEFRRAVEEARREASDSSVANSFASNLAPVIAAHIANRTSTPVAAPLAPPPAAVTPVNRDLEAARAAAAQLSAGSSSSVTANGKVIRKVEFPRIGLSQTARPKDDLKL